MIAQTKRKFGKRLTAFLTTCVMILCNCLSPAFLTIAETETITGTITGGEDDGKPYEGNTSLLDIKMYWMNEADSKANSSEEDNPALNATGNSRTNLVRVADTNNEQNFYMALDLNNYTGENLAPGSVKVTLPPALAKLALNGLLTLAQTSETLDAWNIVPDDVGGVVLTNKEEVKKTMFSTFLWRIASREANASNEGNTETNGNVMLYPFETTVEPVVEVTYSKTEPVLDEDGNSIIDEDNEVKTQEVAFVHTYTEELDFSYNSVRDIHTVRLTEYVSEGDNIVVTTNKDKLTDSKTHSSALQGQDADNYNKDYYWYSYNINLYQEMLARAVNKSSLFIKIDPKNIGYSSTDNDFKPWDYNNIRVLDENNNKIEIVQNENGDYGFYYFDNRTGDLPTSGYNKSFKIGVKAETVGDNTNSENIIDGKLSVSGIYEVYYNNESIPIEYIPTIIETVAADRPDKHDIPDGDTGPIYYYNNSERYGKGVVTSKKSFYEGNSNDVNDHSVPINTNSNNRFMTGALFNGSKTIKFNLHAQANKTSKQDFYIDKSGTITKVNSSLTVNFPGLISIKSSSAAENTSFDYNQPYDLIIGDDTIGIMWQGGENHDTVKTRVLEYGEYDIKTVTINKGIYNPDTDLDADGTKGYTVNLYTSSNGAEYSIYDTQTTSKTEDTIFSLPDNVDAFYLEFKNFDRTIKVDVSTEIAFTLYDPEKIEDVTLITTDPQFSTRSEIKECNEFLLSSNANFEQSFPRITNYSFTEMLWKAENGDIYDVATDYEKLNSNKNKYNITSGQKEKDGNDTEVLLTGTNKIEEAAYNTVSRPTVPNSTLYDNANDVYVRRNYSNAYLRASATNLTSDVKFTKGLEINSTDLNYYGTAKSTATLESENLGLLHKFAVYVQLPERMEFSDGDSSVLEQIYNSLEFSGTTFGGNSITKADLESLGVNIKISNYNNSNREMEVLFSIPDGAALDASQKTTVSFSYDVVVYEQNIQNKDKSDKFYVYSYTVLKDDDKTARLNTSVNDPGYYIEKNETKTENDITLNPPEHYDENTNLIVYDRTYSEIKKGTVHYATGIKKYVKADSDDVWKKETEVQSYSADTQNTASNYSYKYVFDILRTSTESKLNRIYLYDEIEQNGTDSWWHGDIKSVDLSEALSEGFTAEIYCYYCLKESIPDVLS